MKKVKKIFSAMFMMIFLISINTQDVKALTTSDTGTITVTKHVTKTTGTTTMAGVTYKITQTHQIDANGNMIAITGAPYTASIATDASGNAVFNNVPVGRYSIQEISVPDGVILNNTIYTTDLPSDPKQVAPYTAQVDFKDSSSFTADKTQRPMGGTFQIYPVDSPMSIMRVTPFQYQLSTMIPSDIKTPIGATSQLKYTSIVLQDTLNNDLELVNGGNFKVYSNGTLLSSGYTVDVTALPQFKVTVTDMTLLTENTPLTVVFDAQIKASATTLTAIPNNYDVTYNYTNADGTPGATAKIVSASTYTILPPYSLTVTKVDSQNQTTLLSGATFELYKAPTPGATTGGTLVGTSLTTDSTGKIIFPNLSAGDYYLVETAAPPTYNKLLQPIPVKVQTDNTLNTITVQNVKTTVMPGTGGFGPILYGIVGIIGVAMSFFIILGGKNKKSKEVS